MKHFLHTFLSVLLCLFFSCSKEVIQKEKPDEPEKVKTEAETLIFNKLQKAFSSSGSFTVSDMLNNLRGNKTGYTLKSIASVSPSDVVQLSGTKPNFTFTFLKVGAFTATITLEHQQKKDVTITGAQFEITRLPAETLTFTKLSEDFSSSGSFTASEILNNVQGNKTGYTLKLITNFPTNVVHLSGTKPNFSLTVLKRGAFTATLILEHQNKGDATITGAQFEIRSLPAESLTFQKVSKAFSSGGKFTTAEILGGVQGTKTGYTIKSITALNPHNLVTVSATKELNFIGNTGNFTSTIVLEHPAKADVTITGAQFEIAKAPNSIFKIDKDGFISLKDNLVRSRVTNFTIPSSIGGITVTGISRNAFSYCTALTSITIPNSVTTIGDMAFAHCSSLTSIAIPNSVTTIGDMAFARCSSLTSIAIPNSVTTIGDGAFISCYALTSIAIPNSVTTIGIGAFGDCHALISITIPNSVTTIGIGAFNGCSALTSIIIPNSVTTIGNSAFAGCTSLTYITIPNSVTTLGDNVFRDWTNSQTIRVPGTKPASWLAKLKQNNSVPNSNIIAY